MGDVPADIAAAIQDVTKLFAYISLKSLSDASLVIRLSRYRILTVLSAGTPVRSGQLADMLGVDASFVTRHGDYLIETGLADRGTDPANRNVVTLTLTPRGQALVDEVRQLRKDELTRVMRRLSDSDQKTVLRGLRVLAEVAMADPEIAAAPKAFTMF
jgi:DNA-binding MarR family transcriptional regulator